MMKAKKLFSLALAAAVSVSMLAGCGSTDNSKTQTDGSSTGGTYAFVAKDVQNPYMQKVYDGFEEVWESTKGYYIETDVETGKASWISIFIKEVFDEDFETANW